MFSVVLLIVVLITNAVNLSDIRDDIQLYNNELNQRSETDWRKMWHTERFNKCRDDLYQHMFWACNKDIYKLIRRTPPLALGEELQEDEHYETNLQFPWIRASHARRLVRWRRRGDGRGGRKKRSITAECCDPRGCTWEEYAEYCPSKRQIH